MRLMIKSFVKCAKAKFGYTMEKQVCTRNFALFFIFIVMVLLYLSAYRGLYSPGYSIKNSIFPMKFRNTTKELYKPGKCFRLSWNLLQEFGSLSGQSVSLHMIDNVVLDERQKNRTTSNNSQFPNDEANVRREKCKLFLTKTDLVGRLGNQLFQYSSLLGMACEFDYIPIIAKSSSLLQKYFDVPNVVNVQLKNLKTLKCVGSKYAKHYNCSSYLQNQTDGTFVIPGKLYLQSWKYFSKCSFVVKQALKLKQKHIVSARNFLSTNAKGYNTTVCVHVRRGDMLKPVNRDRGFTVPNKSFIHRAKQYFEKEYASVVFIVLSDDIKWCKENLKGNILFSPFKDPGDDMALLTSCDHVIVTSGTFGWWGAWLSGGTTVYFKQYIREHSPLGKGMVLQDYYPSQWIPL